MNANPDNFPYGNPAPLPMQSEQIDQLAAALAAAQGEITGAKKESANPFFKSKYADLASCWEACREPLSKHGLAVVQTTMDSKVYESVVVTEDHKNDRTKTERVPLVPVTVVTTLAHESGQWIRGVMTIYPKEPGPQPFGSCTTYARRYALAAIVGLAQVDDDAEAAQRRTPFKGEPAPKMSAEALEAAQKYVEPITMTAEADDAEGTLQLWTEMSADEHMALWEILKPETRLRSKIKKLLNEAKGLNGSAVTEKDQRREQVRGV